METRRREARRKTRYRQGLAAQHVFPSPSFNDVLAADAKPEDTGLDKPTVATIETFDGFRYESEDRQS